MSNTDHTGLLTHENDILSTRKSPLKILSRLVTVRRGYKEAKGEC